MATLTLTLPGGREATTTLAHEDAATVEVDGAPAFGFVVEDDGAVTVVRWDAHGEVTDQWRTPAPGGSGQPDQ